MIWKDDFEWQKYNNLECGGYGIFQVDNGMNPQ
jgi:hypothetical protein